MTGRQAVYRACDARAYRCLSSALCDPDFAEAVRFLGLAGSCFLAFLTPLRGYELGHLLRIERKVVSKASAPCKSVGDALIARTIGTREEI